MAAAALGKDEALPAIAIENNRSHWTIDLKKDEHKLKLLVFDRDELPEFEILEMK